MRLSTLAFVLALALPVAILPIAGCESKVTAESYAQIKAGMQLFEVEKILGGAGELDDTAGMSISAAGMAGTSRSTSRTTYIWKANGNEISVTLEDGKVVTTGKRGF